MLRSPEEGALNRGTGWSGRRVVVPGAWKGSRVWLNFGGAHPGAEVWLNGVKLGFLPAAD